MQRWQLTTCSTCMYLQRTELNRRSCKMQKSEATSTPPYIGRVTRFVFASFRLGCNVVLGLFVISVTMPRGCS
jgi:hypothetical protein